MADEQEQITAVVPMQAPMFPQSNPHGEDVEIDLSELPSLSGCPEPDPALVASVGELGLLERIKVTRLGEHWYVFDGRRRVLAARQAGLLRVPARSFPAGTINHAALTLVLNQQRHPNVLAEYEAIVALTAQGYDESTIARETGIAVGTIRKRMRLANLIGDLFDLLAARLIRPSLAERIAVLPANLQERLVAIYQENHALTADDVRNVTRQRKAEAVEALPARLFEEESVPWRTQARQLLRAAADLIPEADPQRQRVLDIMADLEAQNA